MLLLNYSQAESFKGRVAANHYVFESEPVGFGRGGLRGAEAHDPAGQSNHNGC